MAQTSTSHNDKPLLGRIALVTGATRGIGRAVAVAMAQAGAHVIATGRTAGALEDVDDEIRAMGGEATLLTLNMKHGEKIDALGPTIFNRWGKLDVVVANAGILGTLSPLGHVSVESWAETLEINLTANWRLIRTLDPVLKLSDAGRAIFVTSGAASAKNAYWGPYAVSKAGLEALVKTYAHEIATTNIRVNLINPGPIRTGMRGKAFPGEDPMTLKTPADIAPLFVKLASAAHAGNGQIHDFATGAVRT
jgi:NAD(P)-dependent dehydrogenase (short-subunit alcohol dehydrogenase family)